MRIPFRLNAIFLQIGRRWIFHPGDLRRQRLLPRRENAELRMLLFPQVLDHVARVDRVVSCPGGNLLLIGRSGVGRRTAAKLVAYMRGYAFHGPTAVRADGGQPGPPFGIVECSRTRV